MKAVVKDVDEEDADFDEQWHVERVCKVIDKVRGLWKEHQKGGREMGRQGLGGGKRSARSKFNESKQGILDALQELRFKKKPINKIVLTLKEFVVRFDRANREISECEHRAGLSLKEFKKTLRQFRSSPLRQRAGAKKLGLHPHDVDEVSRVIAAAKKKKKNIEEEAKLSESVLREIVHEIQDGERMADGQGEAHRGKLASGGVDREKVHEPPGCRFSTSSRRATSA